MDQNYLIRRSARSLSKSQISRRRMSLGLGSNANILVVGDLMLDRCIRGSCTRNSPSAAVPVVLTKQVTDSPGGAANVAMNVASLGCHCALFGVIGEDENGLKLEAMLRDAGIETNLVKSENKPTITKLNVLNQHKPMLRLDFEQIPYSLCDKLVEEFKNALPSAHAVILSDYGKGTLSDVQTLIQLAKQYNIPILVDPKSRDISRYTGATILTPNTDEFREIFGEFENDSQLNELAQAQFKLHDFAAILVTRDRQGMSLLQKDQPPVHMAPTAERVLDVCGAGDTAIAAAAAAFAAGLDILFCANIANVAAGAVVGKTDKTVALQELLPYSKSIVTEAQFFTIREAARKANKKVVFTNGCFDIIHAAHIACLEEAKEQGDLLVVAVNDDQSVKRLKGESRPVIPLEQRMSVLAALQPVDYVIKFSEDTPERLVGVIRPDVLAKGGDYRSEEILAGRDSVLANGGVVKLLYRGCLGCTTTKIIDNITRNK